MHLNCCPFQGTGKKLKEWEFQVLALSFFITSTSLFLGICQLNFTTLYLICTKSHWPSLGHHIAYLSQRMWLTVTWDVPDQFIHIQTVTSAISLSLQWFLVNPGSRIMWWDHDCGCRPCADITNYIFIFSSNYVDTRNYFYWSASISFLNIL